VTAIILAAASDRSSDDIPEILRPNESVEPSASADKKLNWKSTASATGPESHVVTGSGHPDVEGVVESGPHREGSDSGEETVEQIDPSLSTPPLAHDGKPDGM
jgi:hypothetical protein